MITKQDTDELVGLHCFRHLRDQLSSALDSINRFAQTFDVSRHIFGYTSYVDLRSQKLIHDLHLLKRYLLTAK